MIRMDEINKIRKAYYKHDKSKNAIAKHFKRSWETIDRMVSTEREALDKRGKRHGKEATVITPEVIKSIHAYLDDEIEKKVRKKQRYTS